jgi:hypothetical protein
MMEDFFLGGGYFTPIIERGVIVEFDHRNNGKMTQGFTSLRGIENGDMDNGK